MSRTSKSQHALTPKKAELSHEKQAKAIAAKNEKADMGNLIALVLNSPVGEGMVHEVDGVRSMSSFKRANTDMKTRIILGVAYDAASAPTPAVRIQAAEFLMKYGGYEPVKTQHIKVETPTIIDDMPCPESMLKQEATETEEEEV